MFLNNLASGLKALLHYKLKGEHVVACLVSNTVKFQVDLVCVYF